MLPVFSFWAGGDFRQPMDLSDMERFTVGLIQKAPKQVFLKLMRTIPFNPNCHIPG